MKTPSEASLREVMNCFGSLGIDRNDTVIRVAIALDRAKSEARDTALEEAAGICELDKNNRYTISPLTLAVQIRAAKGVGKLAELEKE